MISSSQSSRDSELPRDSRLSPLQAGVGDSLRRSKHAFTGKYGEDSSSVPFDSLFDSRSVSWIVGELVISREENFGEGNFGV